MQFKRPHHQRIAGVLKSLDGALLAQHACFFAGGTALALRYGEYRESSDMDFMVCDKARFQDMRALLQGKAGLAALEKSGASITQIGELRADEYAIRGKINADGFAIKFEIIHEARITFEAASVANKICGAPTLSALDLAAGKLLANTDRWADQGVFSRDLIDLAMMDATKALRKEAIAKAERAYSKAILRDLEKAIDHLLNKPGWLARCVAAMNIHEPKAALMQRVVQLGRDAGVSVKLAQR